jgi:DNA primase
VLSPGAPSLLATLALERGWRYDAIRALGLGLDRGRITIPIRDPRGELQGLLRYQPKPADGPKMLAELGSRVGLIPHPAVETSKRILLVEGPPDMIAARSRGLPAIAVPGDHAWRSTWGDLLAGRRVTIVMDADTQGRAAALRISADLTATADSHVLDLAASRVDGYDLTDWLAERPEPVDITEFLARTPPAQRRRQ